MCTYVIDDACYQVSNTVNRNKLFVITNKGKVKYIRPLISYRWEPFSGTGAMEC